jgi:hypothetical protein
MYGRYITFYFLNYSLGVQDDSSLSSSTRTYLLSNAPKLGFKGLKEIKLPIIR